MPMPRWMARVNRRVFNPRELDKGVRPVLTHVGRVSGATYRTPLEIHRIDGGFVVAAIYTASSDWVRNVLAAGRAVVTFDGVDVAVTAPRIVGADEAWGLLPPDTVRPPSVLRITEFLRVDDEAA